MLTKRIMQSTQKKNKNFKVNFSFSFFSVAEFNNCSKYILEIISSDIKNFLTEM
jgi:hypothetical protein